MGTSSKKSVNKWGTQRQTQGSAGNSGMGTQRQTQGSAGKSWL
ncbi:MAG: hypothetical protein WBA13_13400 [Microcoleaceae cyanobacterium]